MRFRFVRKLRGTLFAPTPCLFSFAHRAIYFVVVAVAIELFYTSFIGRCLWINVVLEWQAIE